MARPPSCKTCCIGYCGCCPCPLCQDNYDLTDAQQDLEALQEDVKSGGAVHFLTKEKGMTPDAANALIEKRVAKAEKKVADAEEAMHDTQLKKFSSSIGFCQTAVTMPCMVGM